MSSIRKSKRHTLHTFIMVLLSFSFLFVLSACNSSLETTTVAIAGAVSTSAQASPTTANVTATATETVTETDISISSEHAIGLSVSPLSEAEKALNLEGYGSKGALADQNLTLGDMLMYAVQDEYLAHGEYELIIKSFGVQNPYSNIIGSEETHLAALKELYTAYGLTFPEDGSDEYVVVPDNLLEAAKTGVQAEIDNIAMYELFLSQDIPDSVSDVFNFLKSASESHLSAFQKQVDKLA